MPTRRTALRLLAALLPGALLPTAESRGAAGGAAAGAAGADAAMPVIASFSILADMVREVGGARVRVTTLVGPDGDAHVYQPTPADARAVAAARLVFVNGLGFEGWIDRLVRSAGFRGEVVVASRDVRAQYLPETEAGHDRHHHGTGAGSHRGEPDPHAWQDMANALLYVRTIAAALIAADPAGRAEFEVNADRFSAEIKRVDGEARAAFAALPADRRTVITSHDAFGYFGRAYGITFIAPVGVSTDAEASAADVARLIRQIRERRVPAVFVENISDPRLLEQISRETGARIGGHLYSDALSPPGGDAATYLDLMRWNFRTLLQALAA